MLVVEMSVPLVFCVCLCLNVYNNSLSTFRGIIVHDKNKIKVTRNHITYYKVPVSNYTPQRGENVPQS